jgi:hypothetical protein
MLNVKVVMHAVYLKVLPANVRHVMHLPVRSLHLPSHKTIYKVLMDVMIAISLTHGRAPLELNMQLYVALVLVVIMAIRH